MGVKNQHITVEVDGKVEVVLVAEVEEGMVEEVDSLKNHGKRNLEEIVAEDITEAGMVVVGKIKTAINKIFKKVSKNKVLSLSVKNLKRKQLFSSSLPMTISM
jgi:ribosomal protein L25 (general stress protein Ctc)